MINSKLKLSNLLFKKDIEKIPTRNGYGDGLVAAGENDEKVVVLSADVGESTRAYYFKEKFPNRYIEVGVDEQALATVAAGMANYGKIPFISSYAIFSPGRNWEQIRTTIALNDVPVKLAGSHAGISVGADGATHQALEDIALMRVMPNMIVVVPCDAIEAKKAVVEAAKNKKPTYIRLTREATPVMTSWESPFKIGTAEVFWEAKDPQATIIGCGPLLYDALLAAKKLKRSAIEVEVINCHTIKPIDVGAIILAAKKSEAIVTLEDHQIAAGLGGAVAEVLAGNFPTPVEFMGIKDSFGESGKPAKLLKKYGLKSDDIVSAVKRVLRKKISN